MDELTKIRRIIDKRLPGAQPETLFVLDATTGQNGLAPGQGVPRGRRADRDRPDQARFDRQGRDRLRDRARPRRARPVRRRGGAGGRPPPVRSRRVRGGALRLIGAAAAPAPGPSSSWPARRVCATLRPPRCVRTRAPPGRRRIRATTSGPSPRRSPIPTVFDTLSERLRKTLADLTGRGRVSEADVDAAMREIRLSLLEADVNFKVVKDFVARVREQAIGAEILAEPDRRPADREDRPRRAGRAPRRRRSDVPPAAATRRSSRWSASRARARRRRRPSSPATSSGRAAGRSSSPPTRTGRPPPTSSRRSARRSTSRSTARPPARRSSTSPAAASRRPAARPATS